MLNIKEWEIKKNLYFTTCCVKINIVCYGFADTEERDGNL